MSLDVVCFPDESVQWRAADSFDVNGLESNFVDFKMM